MPGIGLLIREIGFEIKAFWEYKTPVLHGLSNGLVVCVVTIESNTIHSHMIEASIAWFIDIQGEWNNFDLNTKYVDGNIENENKSIGNLGF